MITIEETENVKIVSDDANPRIYEKYYRCAACRKWIDEDETVWIPDWENGKPYHVDCAPDEY